MTTFKSGLALATAAAALFAVGSVTSVAHAGDTAADAASVKCAGTNSCKGTSECKTASSACKGQNACKGQGWVSKKSAEECTKDGGKVVQG